MIAFIFCYSLLSGAYSLPQVVKLSMERDGLIQSNREQFAALVDAERIKGMLTNNPLYIKFIARTKYHMVFPNETVYRHRGH